ncbi:MAG: NUDIX hydrolase [Ignavibacteriae bacterium]|nr:NUDIX hydrolase [Ignavibacteriota bacterium]MCB9216415.1 NUDIX hydrolase [Ignavibacteria bacterium]
MSDSQDRVEVQNKETASRPVEAWETLSSEQIADCHVFTVHRHKRRSPDGIAEGDFHTISAPDWVNVIALTESGDMVMICQYRHGTNELAWEIPGGMIDPGEAPEEAARRELLEETGYEADEIQLIGSVRPNPALFDNTNYTVLARGVRQVGLQSLDEHEDIHVAVYSPEEVDQMVVKGEVNHALVIDALYWLRRCQP